MAHRSALAMQSKELVDTTLTLGIGGSGSRKMDHPVDFQLFSPAILHETEDHRRKMKQQYIERQIVASDEGERTRKKLKLSTEQISVMEERFSKSNAINAAGKQELAKRLSLTPYQIEIWFQNRRARDKIKQTEANYESMKKCFMILGEENQRLKMELQVARLAIAKQPPMVIMGSSLCLSCKQAKTGGDGQKNEDRPTVAIEEPSASNSNHTSSSPTC